ncbi:MAG TPA: hypothetical protein DEP05_02855 [Betaproteobacteria bacterium]|nr:hypothetical protein [Betaproteobacteria bacterium]
MTFFRTGFNEVKGMLKQLAEDMHKLAIADAERREDRKTFDRLFHKLESHDQEFIRLWEKTEAIDAERQHAEAARLREELARKNRWIGEAAKIAAIVAVSVLLARLGVKLL